VLERGVYMSTGTGGFRLPMLPGSGRPLDGAVQTASTPARAPQQLPEFDEKLSFRDNKERWSDEFERRYLTWLLERNQGNISRAAREADMDRKYLHKLLKKHNIVA
jgi:transcriptional regulator of acetoin/glycerol metabolism